MSKKRKTGTREWAQKTVNCVLGCEHDCRYCYARYDMIERFRKIPKGSWATPKVRTDEVLKSRPKYSGVVMFPSTHDVTPSVLGECLVVLGRLLKSGNEVLLVSKPHFECIKAIVYPFEAYTDKLRFRFTIGSPRDEVLKFWEPGAPSFTERLRSLILAYEMGFKTSISAEPLLDPDHVKDLWDRLIPYVNWEFWIGKMNKTDSRVDTNDPEVRKMLIPILEGQTDERVMEIWKMFKNEKFVQWKDSYKEVIERCLKNDFKKRLEDR